ncbi:DUF484 family protein, partial [Pantoea agglomerans]|uniref:DUF484 family protein n=1 Tax=Enterobacter agglomerans TaxID=549 RepID=UPI003F6DD98D
MDQPAADWLKQGIGQLKRRHHPGVLFGTDFFIRNARAVEQMAVPHPVRGSFSLVEWHMARQRNHIQRL